MVEGGIQFTKEPPRVDRKTIIKPKVEKMDRLRRISTGCMRTEYSGSGGGESSTSGGVSSDNEQRSSSIKHVDFHKGVY